jgi:hypothetical protein
MKVGFVKQCQIEVAPHKGYTIMKTPKYKPDSKKPSISRSILMVKKYKYVVVVAKTAVCLFFLRRP